MRLVRLVCPTPSRTCDGEGDAGVPFRYCHCSEFAERAPAANRPTQSRGLPGPFATVAVTVPPTNTLVAFSTRVGASAAVTVKETLGTRTVSVLLRKKRSS